MSDLKLVAELVTRFTHAGYAETLAWLEDSAADGIEVELYTIKEIVDVWEDKEAAKCPAL